MTTTPAPTPDSGGQLTTTTGTAVILADHCKNNFFDIVEAHLENFFSKVTNASNVILDLPNEVKRISRLLTGAAGGYIGSLAEQLTGAIAPIIRNGLTDIANNVEKLLIGKSVTEVIKKTTEEQDKLKGPIKELFAGLECLASKVIDAAEKIFNGLVKSSSFEIHFPKGLTLTLKFLRILPYRLYLFLVDKLVKR